MEARNLNTDDRDPETDPDRHAASASPVRRVIVNGVGGAVGGGVFALIQYLVPGLFAEPRLVRWVFLYALLGGVLTGVWQAATQWAAARFLLSRRRTVVVSALVAGMLLGVAGLLVATIRQGAGTDGLLLLRLPWADGLGGLVGGAVGGGLWQYLSP